MKYVEKWDIFEVSFSGTVEGNPYMDVQFSAVFTNGIKNYKQNGFYDGLGVYKLRFMPNELGNWSYKTQSDTKELGGLVGEFYCEKPDICAHGPIKVNNTFELAYADGERYHQIGTTCYVWNHQPATLREQTLLTLSKSPFNKIRMCVFPKHYDFSTNKMDQLPFAGSETDIDYERFNPKYWEILEDCIKKLMVLGIQADIILFHPYDRWGFAKMSKETDEFYLKYVVARLSAYSNVWWSFANEYDLMPWKNEEDWDDYFKLVQSLDPHDHLRGNHNCRGFYDHSKKWVTHCSIQSSDMEDIPKWRDMYKKPIIIDECCYEGNIQHNWGNISAQTMVSRFWDGLVRGAYVGHGETYLHSDDVLWWSKGGVLHGQSPERIAFYKKYLERLPEGCELLEKGWGWGILDKLYISYVGERCPARKTYDLPTDKQFTIEIIDTWDMTSKMLPGTYSGSGFIPLPQKPYIAYWIEEAWKKTQ